MEALSIICDMSFVDGRGVGGDDVLIGGMNECVTKTLASGGYFRGDRLRPHI
jgi:hypothetical protein